MTEETKPAKAKTPRKRAPAKPKVVAPLPLTDKQRWDIRKILDREGYAAAQAETQRLRKAQNIAPGDSPERSRPAANRKLKRAWGLRKTAKAGFRRRQKLQDAKGVAGTAGHLNI